MAVMSAEGCRGMTGVVLELRPVVIAPARVCCARGGVTAVLFPFPVKEPDTV